MRGQAMKRICDKLIINGFRLDKYIALEFFAREGNWQTQSFSQFVKTLHAWEIDEKFKEQLLLNHPNANIRIGDSFNISRELKYKSFFDFIVIDNPQGVFNGYCEHFEALNRVKFLLKNSGIVIFNVNKKPFNYSENSNWAIRRNNFYGRNANKLDTEFLVHFYGKFFNDINFKVNEIFEEKRNNEYLSYIVAIIEKLK